MATVTSRPARPGELDPNVSHPLDQLRGTIRRYVVFEGLLSAAIFVAAWFVLGLALDFGVFKVATWDWVLDAPWWFRLVALLVTLVLLAGIVTFRIVTRLTKDLSYPALALVLERRFPGVLGDRLITAVELADVESQARYGYSREMIVQTIDEARERVGTVPVNDVFNWRRLWVLGIVAAGLFLAVIVFGYVSYAVAAKSLNPYRFGWRMAHVSATYLERNVLLQNTPWPRRVHLELVGFPGDELRVGKDAPAPVINAKAYRWVVADRKAPMGWRPMVWGDVAGVISAPVPELPVHGFAAAAPGAFTGDPNGWEVDQIEAVGTGDSPAHTALLSELHNGEGAGLGGELDRVFAELEEKAANPSMARRLRKLDVPDKLTLVYSGPSKNGDVTLSPQQNQEFSAPVPDLKESVTFVVRAEDFRTSDRQITLVPPPMLSRLALVEYQPAYLHHAPPVEDGYPALRGLRQKMAEKTLSLTGDLTRLDVPSGTELILTATADTDLVAAFLQPKVGILPRAKPGSADPVPVQVGEDGRTVTVEFRGDYRFGAGRTFEHRYTDADGQARAAQVITTPTVEFDLVVQQADGISARRQVMIQVIEDQPPVVEVAVDVVRKVGNVYYVTPKARLPFNPESFVRDDHGISKVAYDAVYWAEDSDLGRAMRIQLTTRPFLYAPNPVAIPAAVAAPYHAVKFKDLDKGDNRQTASFGLARFEDQKNQLRRNTRQVFEKQLNEPVSEATAQVVRTVDLKSHERDFFDIGVLKLTAEASEVQTRYRLDLNVVATDTNFDTGPKTGQNLEPIRLLVVSEGDLLAEINKEEEAFAARLDEALAKIAGAKHKWQFVRSENAAGLGAMDLTNLDSARVKAQDVSQDIAKAHDIVRSVVGEYRRIHKECIVNQVIEVTRDKFGTFGNRIDRVLGENPPPINEDEQRQIAAGLLTPKMTFPATEKRLQAVLDAMNTNAWADPASVGDAEVAMNLLEQEVSTIRKMLGELQSRDRLKKLLSSVIESQKRIRKEIEDWAEVVNGRLTKKEPEIQPVGPVFLTKGETKKIKHGLLWLQYESDDLAVQVSVMDKDMKPIPADVLGVPAELNLNFEKHTLDFEYDVKAGAKEGEYTITLKPEVGAPVTVAVTVK